MPSSGREATEGRGQDKGGPQGTRQRGSARKNERRAIGIRAGRRGPQTLWPSELSAGALDESDDSPMSVQFPTKLQAPHLPSSSAGAPPKQSLPPPPSPGVRSVKRAAAAVGRGRVVVAMGREVGVADAVGAARGGDWRWGQCVCVRVRVCAGGGAGGVGGEGSAAGRLRRR